MGRLRSPKWADYCISEVRYNADHTHIEFVKVHRDDGETISGGVVMPRQVVVDEISKGTTFATTTIDAFREWHPGQVVIVVTINGTQFLKTVADDTESDNLENLPEF